MTRGSNLIQYKAHERSGFTIIANEAIQDSQLSLKAKGLHHYLLSLPSDWNVSISGLSKCLKESETAIRNALKELESAGYLRRTRILPSNTESHQIEYLYEVYELSQNIDHQHTENLHADDQYTDDLSVEKPAENNKKEKGINTKEISTHQETHTGQQSELGTYEKEFEKLWSRYPKKRGRKEALQGYIKARKNGTTFDEVEKGLNRYIQYLEDNCTKERYIMEGGRWFAGCRWTDDYTISINTSDPFMNYQQREWDYDEIDKLLRENFLASSIPDTGPNDSIDPLIKTTE